MYSRESEGKGREVRCSAGSDGGREKGIIKSDYLTFGADYFRGICCGPALFPKIIFVWDWT